MGLNGIDISGWQEGIDLSAVAADFVIMKATQGTGFVSKDFVRQYQQAKENGKLVGCYHYAEGGDYVAEANHFLDVVGNQSVKLFFVLIGKDRIIQHLVRTISIGLKDSVIMYSLRLV